MAKVKQIMPLLVVIFLVYAVVSSPDRSADLVRNVVDILSDGVTNIGTFFDNLLNG